LKVKITVVGVLETFLPNGDEIIEADDMTIQGLLDMLVTRFGASAKKELLDSDGLQKGLSSLVNGRNVLSLPEEFQTALHDGDEVVITVQVSGG
jgi:molybdopterin converting factor small subunit